MGLAEAGAALCVFTDGGLIFGESFGWGGWWICGLEVYELCSFYRGYPEDTS